MPPLLPSALAASFCIEEGGKLAGLRHLCDGRGAGGGQRGRGLDAARGGAREAGDRPEPAVLRADGQGDRPHRHLLTPTPLRCPLPAKRRAAGGGQQGLLASSVRPHTRTCPCLPAPPPRLLHSPPPLPQLPPHARSCHALCGRGERRRAGGGGVVLGGLWAAGCAARGARALRSEARCGETGSARAAEERLPASHSRSYADAGRRRGAERAGRGGGGRRHGSARHSLRTPHAIEIAHKVDMGGSFTSDKPPPSASLRVPAPADVSTSHAPLLLLLFLLLLPARVRTLLPPFDMSGVRVCLAKRLLRSHSSCWRALVLDWA
eukprot:1829140-Rhodomonas_salina.1